MKEISLGKLHKLFYLTASIYTSHEILNIKRHRSDLDSQSEAIVIVPKAANFPKQNLLERSGVLFYVLGTVHVTSDPADGDGPSTVGPLGPVGTLIPLSGRGGVTGIRRGPGRPRLRPTGPGHQGYRAPGQHHGKKIQRPLPVPIRSHQTIGQHQQKASSSQQRSRVPTTGPSSSSSSSSSSVAIANSTSLLSSSSSLAESRPFGFYTQQQPRAGSS